MQLFALYSPVSGGTHVGRIDIDPFFGTSSCSRIGTFRIALFFCTPLVSPPALEAVGSGGDTNPSQRVSDHKQGRNKFW